VETDFTIPNLGTPLEMVRSYDSFNTVASGTSWSDRGMGDGWSFSYSDEITLATTLKDPADANDTNGTLVWFTSSGLLLQFLPDGTGYTTPAGIFGTLATWTNGTSSGYLWTDATGSKTTFTTIGSIAYVTQISDRYGNGVYIQRNTGNGQIVKVCDLFEYDQTHNVNNSTRYLTVTYNAAGHITQIADFTGRTWTYGYDSSSPTGRLVSVTAPVASTAPLDLTQYTYYSDTTLNDLLKTVADADGNVTQFSYYANRRGFQEMDPKDDVQSFSYNLFRNRTAFTNENGQGHEGSVRDF
jgi:YD repeat-containing protein